MEMFHKIYRAHYRNIIYGTRQGSPTRWAKFKENVWSLLLLLKQKAHHRELLNIRLNNHSNTLAVQTAKNHRVSPFFFLRDSILVDIFDVLWFSEISVITKKDLQIAVYDKFQLLFVLFSIRSSRRKV